MKNTKAGIKAFKDLRRILTKAAPKAIIKKAWGMPTLYQDGIVISFMTFKNHMSVFPGPEAIEKVKGAKKHRSSKGTLQFAYDEKLPAALLTRLVKFRVKQNQLKAKKRKKLRR